jgi:hypothetical protein
MSLMAKTLIKRWCAGSAGNCEIDVKQGANHHIAYPACARWKQREDHVNAGRLCGYLRRSFRSCTATGQVTVHGGLE